MSLKGLQGHYCAPFTMIRGMYWQLSNIVNSELIQTKGRESVLCCFRTFPVLVPGAPRARQNAAITDSHCLGADRCLSAGDGTSREDGARLGGLSLASIVYDLVDGKLPVRQRQADRSGRKAVRTQQSDLTT